jgi:hypothetical protein
MPSDMDDSSASALPIGPCSFFIIDEKTNVAPGSVSWPPTMRSRASPSRGQHACVYDRGAIGQKADIGDVGSVSIRDKPGKAV